MRMWMVDPTLLCHKHLLGEHGELHKFLKSWEKQYSIDGRIEGNAIEPMSYKKRHDQLAEELLARGYNHQSPLEQPDFMYLPLEQLKFKVDVDLNFKLLIDRCPDCKARYHNKKYKRG